MPALRPVPRGPHIDSPEEPQHRLRREVHAGLRANPKMLPPKLFYDDTGARLFEEIPRLDEYYVTRTEHEIMEAHATEIAALLGPHAVILEPGRVAALKVRVLLDQLARPAAYVPTGSSAE